MGKKSRRRESTPVAASRRSAAYWVLPALFFLAQVLVIPGGTSPFRLPKMALMVAGLALVLAGAVFSSVRRGSLRFANGPLALTLISLPPLQILSCLWAGLPSKALATGIVSAVWVAAILLVAQLQRPQRQAVLLATAIGAGVSAVVMLGNAVGLGFLPVIDGGLKFRQRLVGLSGNPADLAMTAAILLPLVLCRRPESRHHRLTLMASMALLLSAAILGQTIAALAAVAAVMLLWVQHRRTHVHALALSLLVIAVLSALVLWAPTKRFAGIAKTIERGNWYALLSARFDGWSAAAQMIADAPVLGVGAGHFDHAYYESRVRWLKERDQVGRRGELATHFDWAHCDPLQMQAELGILGAVWMLSLLWALLRSRQRGDPLLVLGMAAAAPLLLLHYPCHVSAGLIPLALLLSEILAKDPSTVHLTVKRPVWRAAIALGVATVAVAIAGWQLRVVALDSWRGAMETALQTLPNAAPDSRDALATLVEKQTVERLRHNPNDTPWLWSLLGRARLARGQAESAELAFRRSMALGPHEEAEFGLGLALAAQGQRSQALIHLGRVCRTNTSLTTLIEDPDLQRAVHMLTRARTKRSRGKPMTIG